MDYQNAEFYKLNKNTPDLVYNFADELITYRKEEDENGNLQIVEYRKKDGRKGKKTTRRVVPFHEMSIEDFDAWKTRLTEEALEYQRFDHQTTRNNVGIENLLETDLVCEESVEDEYLREEEERHQYDERIAKAREVLAILTPTQRKRYVLSKAYGMTTREIAEKEGCEQRAVVKSLQQAEKKLKKALDTEKS